MKTVFILFAFSAFLCGQLSAAPAAPGDDVVALTYPPSQVGGELSCEAHFYLWLPPGVKQVRGVIVHQHGCGQGAQMGCLAAAQDLHWRALAEKWDCALLGTSYRAPDNDCGAWADPRRGSRETFHRVLRELAAKTKHPEIENAPWCLWGHSGGGWWASDMLALEPERCVAVWLRSGSAYGGKLDAKDKAPPAVPAAALRVPVMCNPGAKEKGDARFSKAYDSTLTHFRDWRAKGALIGFAADPNSGHDCGGSRYLAIPFFDTALAARLPEKNGPLQPMPTDGAWLAAPFSSEAKPAATFTGPAQEAVWLPNERLAIAWSEYVREARVADTTPPPAPDDVQLRGGELTWRVRADLESGLRGFLIERDGEPLASLPAKLDERTVFQGITFHDTPRDPVPALAFTDPAPKPGAKYRVLAVNTAGLKSALSPPATAVPAALAPDSPPLPPLESMRKIHLSPGFGVELVASEPLVFDPVAIDWSPDGRLWVVEMADYPLGMDGKGKPGGRVRVLEDTDGDGRYDKSTWFADGLSFPTGLLTWRDGVIVTAAPEILFLRDTNGDGKADSREVLVSGLLEGNQQLRANGLRWGLDGWVYCAAGGYHRGYGAGNKIRSTRAGSEVAVGALDFRFKPDTGELEPESGPSQFGRNRDDWGHWFGTQNSRPLWHYVLADRYLRRNPHVAAPDPTRQVVVPLNPKVWPVSSPEKRYHTFDEAGHFTSACAGTIYRDELLFGKSSPGIEEMNAFTCEPVHNLVQRNVITQDGVTFAARRAPGEERSDFFASEDRWCRPVMTRTGPDGALWVVDMYRYMIEHPDWLPAKGRAELLPHYRLGDDKGRIYRVFPTGTPPRKLMRLDRLDSTELVAALDSPNEWQRDKAHMMLVWRGDKSATAPLAKLAAESANPLARLQALCALDGLGGLSPAQVIRALNDAHPGVRENALRIAEKQSSAKVLAAAVKLIDDPDAKVRLQLAFTLGEWTAPRAGQTLGRLAVANHADNFMVAAVMSSAVPHARALVDAAVRADNPALATLSEPLVNLTLGLNQRDALAALLAPTLSAKDGAFTAMQMTAFSQFLDTLARRKTTLASLSTVNDTLAKQLVAAEPLFASAKQMADDESGSIAARAGAASLLAKVPARRAETLALLSSWLVPRQPAELQRAGIRALAMTSDASVSATLLSGWPSFSPETRVAALGALLSREPWTFATLVHAETNAAPAFDAAQRGQLLKHSSARVRDLAGKVFNAAGASSRVKVIEQFQPALKLAGNAARGEAVFTKLCSVCHQRGDVGHKVGPDLVSVANHPPEKLLANILDPSADVQPGFHAYHCRLTDGTELYGLIGAETGNSITFKLADGTTRVVLRASIAELNGGATSLMPEGLEAGLSHQDMADLIQFLRAAPNAP